MSSNSKVMFFLQQSATLSELTPKNLFCRYILPYICDSLGQIFSKNKNIHPWADSPQPNAFLENRFKTRLVSYVLIHMITLRNCDQGLPKRKTSPPLLSLLNLFRSPGRRNSYISFRNIAKNGRCTWYKRIYVFFLFSFHRVYM